MIAYDLSQDKIRELGLKPGDIPDKGILTIYEITKDILTVIADKEIPQIPLELKQPVSVIDKRTGLAVDISSMNVGDIENMDRQYKLKIGDW